MPDEDIRSVLKYINKHKKQGDVLYLYCFSVYPFMYYSERYGFDKDDYIEGIYSTYDWSKYLDDLEKLRGNERVWLVFSHTYKLHGSGDESFILDHLDMLGTRLDSFKSVGAAAYLYNLSHKHENSGNKTMSQHQWNDQPQGSPQKRRLSMNDFHKGFLHPLFLGRLS